VAARRLGGTSSSARFGVFQSKPDQPITESATLEALVNALGPHLVSTADRISARLGYWRDDEQAP
jgi:hypothetical protein